MQQLINQTEAEVLETFYSKEELEQSPELWKYYEAAKQDETAAELASLMFVLEEHASAEATAKFKPLREQINGAIKAGTLSERFTPAEFISWVKGHGIALPDELNRAIKQRNVLHDLKARCDLISGERDAFRRERDELRAALKESERRNNPKVRTTLYQMIYGMAKFYWGHDHRRGTSSVAREISEDLGEVGIRIHRDTVRDHLGEAVDELPEDWEVHNPLNPSD